MAESGKGWLKYGCLGCLGFVAVVVLAVGIVVGVAARSARSEVVAEDVITPELPAAPEVTLTGEGPDLAQAQAIIESGAVGRVVLDLSGAEFEIDSARPGEPLSVDASYDTLPARFLNEPLQDGPSAGSKVDLEILMQEYYEIREWDENGTPRKEKLEELGLKPLEG